MVLLGAGGSGLVLAPLWAGKEYGRRMQRTDKSVTMEPLVRLSLQLVQAVGVWGGWSLGRLAVGA